MSFPSDYEHGSVRVQIIRLEAEVERLTWLLKERDSTIARLERLYGDRAIKERGRP